MRVWAAKVLVLSGLFLMTFLCSLIPIKFIQLAERNQNPHIRRRYKRAISFLSCFAAGVFLATCLLDLFPEVRKQVEHAFQLFEVDTQFPVAEFIMVFGLFMILITEQMVLTIKEKLSQKASLQSLPSDLPKSVQDPTENDSLLGNEVHVQPRMYRSQSSLSQGISNQPSLGYVEEESLQSTAQSYIDSDHHGHSDSHEDLHTHSPVRAFMLLLALSLHSIFEGLAVGLQPSINSVVEIFAALVLHKCILAFSLGLNLVQSKLRLTVIVRSNFLFAITSPIAIALGIAIVDIANKKESMLINGTLQGIACGTFLYVTFFEVLPHEFNNNKQRMIKVLCTLLGFAAVCAIIFLNPDNDTPLCPRTCASQITTTTVSLTTT